MTPQQRAFILEQHSLYGMLAGQIREIHAALDGGADVADVLLTQTQSALESAITREQLASALASLMIRVAQEENLLAAGAGTVPLLLAGLLPLRLPRGGARSPEPPDPRP